MAEFGACMRNEAQGAMHGIMRVRAFKQDDAHIFCTTEQMPGELVAFCHLLREVYQEIGFTNVAVKLSTRPEKRVGADELWEQAEAALAAACDAAGLTYGINPGEGAFYGPKLEFQIRDAIGRNWQCGTLQVDFNLPGRLDAEYVGPDGQKHTPVMLHRAILGSLERFTGILIENFAGHFPLWLAPVQVVVSGIVDKQNPAVEALVARLKTAGLRAEADTRNEKINLKIREHSLQKVPVFVVLGDKEVADGTATVRRLGSTAQTTVPVDTLIADLLAEVASKSLPPETASNAA
jgi:threonyl-tRNA synthetase